MKNPKTILIIDDEEDLRDTVGYSLKSKGYEIETAYDGQDGLEKLKSVKPDLIILDMNMPRMNGVEFYEKMRDSEDIPNYPVLVLTARANMEQLFRDLDVDGFMAKPFDLVGLASEAERILKKNSRAVKKREGSDEIRARRVCIVENDREILKDLSISFLENGYIVNSAQSGASAIKRIMMDLPDLVVIELGLSDIAGDVVVFKLKNLEVTKNLKFVLYSPTSGDKAEITDQIGKKDGIDQFIQMSVPDDVIDAADECF